MLSFLTESVFVHLTHVLEIYEKTVVSIHFSLTKMENTETGIIKKNFSFKKCLECKPYHGVRIHFKLLKLVGSYNVQRE